MWTILMQNSRCHGKAGPDGAGGFCRWGPENNRCRRLTLVQQLLGVGGFFALRLKESTDALPDQVLPAWPARRAQSTGFYRDDLPWRWAEEGGSATLICLWLFNDVWFFCKVSEVKNTNTAAAIKKNQCIQRVKKKKNQMWPFLFKFWIFLQLF